MSDLKIEAGKFYKTRDGKKARIYATDGGECYPVHGAILVCNKEWCTKSWKADGREWFWSQTIDDIVSPWIDPPVVDWDSLPKHIVAVAMDENGLWYGYVAVPKRYESDWDIKERYYYSDWLLYCEHTPAFSGDWRDSLAVRPGYEG